MANESDSVPGVAGEVLKLLQQNPEGLTLRDLRVRLNATEGQEQFGRRIRELRQAGWDYTTRRVGPKDTLYVLAGRRSDTTGDDGKVSERLRAAVIHAAHGRCQMCGQTVSDDHIKLQADHKVPASWGGTTDLDNLWALCEACNRGKRNFFASFDSQEMRAILAFESVHERIAQLLRLHLNKPVPAELLHFVANAVEQQEDWQKRLRELRYPVIGLRISVSKRKVAGKVKSFYTLHNWRDLPPDHVRLMKEHERATKLRRSDS